MYYCVNYKMATSNTDVSSIIACLSRKKEFWVLSLQHFMKTNVFIFLSQNQFTVKKFRVQKWIVSLGYTMKHTDTTSYPLEAEAVN